MREWSLGGRSIVAINAADMRFGPPDYLNDHIWELSLSSGEPPSLSIQTTYGLRARSMRLFYRFLEAGKSVITPSSFHEAPRVLHFYPDFLVLRLFPSRASKSRRSTGFPNHT
jgi:hypothetical protein